MTTAFSQRFQQVVDQLTKGNKKRFAELTGKSASHIYKICRGVSRPSMGYLQHLYDEYHINLHWLLTGDKNDDTSLTSAPSKEIVFTPMFDVQASAGGGAVVNVEEVSEYFAFNKSFLSRQLGVSGEQLAFVTISGDSMQPTFEDGDHVLVDMSQKQVNAEGLFLVQLEDGLLAKRLQRKNGDSLLVMSDNPDYSTQEVDLKNMESHPVVGKIVWCTRSV